MPSIDEPEWLAGNLVLRGFFTQTLQGLAHCCRIYLSPAARACHSTGMIASISRKQTKLKSCVQASSGILQHKLYLNPGGTRGEAKQCT